MQLGLVSRRVFEPFSITNRARPKVILFGQEGSMILRCCGRGESCQRVAVVPPFGFWPPLDHPLRKGAPYGQYRQGDARLRSRTY
jgi:hypothetical protein